MTSRAALSFCLIALSSPAAARFASDDARDLDREVVYNTETYNDKISYRYPFAWRDTWEAHDRGLRLNAGSLDVKRFAYQEEVKLWFNRGWRDGPHRFAFIRERREDTLEHRESGQVRIDRQVTGPWSLGLLADGGSTKAYGDLGFAVGHWRDASSWVELTYWSVDHFYATKKDEPGDTRPKAARTVETNGAQRAGEVQIVWRYEHDLPLVWHFESAGFDYEYERREGELRLRTGDLGTVRPFLALATERKTEKKTALDTTASESLARRVTQIEAGAERRTASGRDQALGLIHLERHALYEPGVDSARSELMAYGTDLHGIASDKVVQWGVHLNGVRVREGDTKRRLEAKAQAAWGVTLTRGVDMLLNTTWDLDQLVRDYPYDEEPFRPWGGGDIQFLAVF